MDLSERPKEIGICRAEHRLGLSSQDAATAKEPPRGSCDNGTVAPNAPARAEPPDGQLSPGTSPAVNTGRDRASQQPQAGSIRNYFLPCARKRCVSAVARVRAALLPVVRLQGAAALGSPDGPPVPWALLLSHLCPERHRPTPAAPLPGPWGPCPRRRGRLHPSRGFWHLVCLLGAPQRSGALSPSQNFAGTWSPLAAAFCRTVTVNASVAPFLCEVLLHPQCSVLTGRLGSDLAR